MEIVYQEIVSKRKKGRKAHHSSSVEIIRTHTKQPKSGLFEVLCCGGKRNSVQLEPEIKLPKEVNIEMHVSVRQEHDFAIIRDRGGSLTKKHEWSLREDEILFK